MAQHHQSQTSTAAGLANQQPSSVTAAPTSPPGPTEQGSEQAWEQWFWKLLEMSWVDVWKVMRRWEGRLRPDSQPLVRVWFAALAVTALSGGALLLSLLMTPPDPKSKRAHPTSARRTRTLSPPRVSQPPLSPVEVLPATSSNDATVGRVHHADYQKTGTSTASERLEPFLFQQSKSKPASSTP